MNREVKGIIFENTVSYDIFYINKALTISITD